VNAPVAFPANAALTDTKVLMGYSRCINLFHLKPSKPQFRNRRANAKQIGHQLPSINDSLTLDHTSLAFSSERMFCTTKTTASAKMVNLSTVNDILTNFAFLIPGSLNQKYRY